MGLVMQIRGSQQSASVDPINNIDMGFGASGPIKGSRGLQGIFVLLERVCEEKKGLIFKAA
jgi:hypothetical protein